MDEFPLLRGVGKGCSLFYPWASRRSLKLTPHEGMRHAHTTGHRYDLSHLKGKALPIAVSRGSPVSGLSTGGAWHGCPPRLLARAPQRSKFLASIASPPPGPGFTPASLGLKTHDARVCVRGRRKCEAGARPEVPTGELQPVAGRLCLLSEVVFARGSRSGQ
jgi:hypothetical protein